MLTIDQIQIRFYVSRFKHRFQWIETIRYRLLSAQIDIHKYKETV